MKTFKQFLSENPPTPNPGDIFVIIHPTNISFSLDGRTWAGATLGYGYTRLSAEVTYQSEDGEYVHVMWGDTMTKIKRRDFYQNSITKNEFNRRFLSSLHDDSE